MARYNEAVRDIFGLGRVTGEVGIEIEMEGRGFIRGGIAPYWDYHRDGSLRGEENAEYVLSRPLDRKDVPKALKVLFGELKAAGTRIRKDSPNTSVHIHLNIQDWSVKKVYNLITLWYIFEKILVDWCGEERAGNLFCLRGSDAEVALMRLASAVRYSKYQTIGDQDGLRYLALNYTALAKFGSLEFRPLAGVYEEDTINTWVTILLALKDYAEKFVAPPDVVTEMSRLGHDDFIKSVFPNGLHKKILTPDYTADMQAGMRLIQPVAFSVNWDREDVKKKVPSNPVEDGQPLNGDEEGTWYNGRFVLATEWFPNYGGEGGMAGVNQFIRLRDAHNARKIRLDQLQNMINPPDAQPEPVRARRPGRPPAWGLDHDAPEAVPVPEPQAEHTLFVDDNGVQRMLGRNEAITMVTPNGIRQRVHYDNIPGVIRLGWLFV